MTVAITLTRKHQAKLRAATERLGLTRSDVIALLIDLHVDTVRIPHDLIATTGSDALAPEHRTHAHEAPGTALRAPR